MAVSVSENKRRVTKIANRMDGIELSLGLNPAGQDHCNVIRLLG